MEVNCYCRWCDEDSHVNRRTASIYEDEVVLQYLLQTNKGHQKEGLEGDKTEVYFTGTMTRRK